MGGSQREDGSVADQWGITLQTRVWLGGHALDAKRVVESKIVGVPRPPSGPIDVALIAPKSVDEFAYFAAKLCRRLSVGGSIWLIATMGKGDAAKAPAGKLSELSDVAQPLGLRLAKTITIQGKITAAKFLPAEQ